MPGRLSDCTLGPSRVPACGPHAPPALQPPLNRHRCSWWLSDEAFLSSHTENQTLTKLFYSWSSSSYPRTRAGGREAGKRGL